MKSKKIKKLSIPATSLQNDETSAKVFPANQNFGKFLTTGNWTKTNSEKDKKIEDLATFIQDPPKPFNNSKKQIIVDAKKYLNLKDEIARKRRDQNKKTLMYTLIDPKNRETEKMANSMFPELLKTNDEFFYQNLELQKKLYRMIQRGTFESRKELEEFYYMLTNPDFILPLGPSWDPNKIIFKRSIFSYISSEKQHYSGIWNPKKIFNVWPSEKNAKNAYNYKELLETMISMGSSNDILDRLESDKPIGSPYDQIFLKLAFAARICPMFSDKNPRSATDIEEMLRIIGPVLLGEDGLDVNIFEVDPDAPSPTVTNTSPTVTNNPDNLVPKETNQN